MTKQETELLMSIIFPDAVEKGREARDTGTVMQENPHRCGANRRLWFMGWMKRDEELKNTA